MSNLNFYNNFPGNSFTFHSAAPNFPPPPAPPAYLFMPLQESVLLKQDQEYVKRFERNSIADKSVKPIISISAVKEQLRNLALTLNDLKDKEKTLLETLDSLTEEEWRSKIYEVEKNTCVIKETMAQINDTYLEMLRKLLAKRSAKRLRLKRVRMERKREKEEWMKDLKERSRKIDENLQKIKDDINRAKQEEESKIQADVVLKEVLRHKLEAKKCIVKLDALMKLRRARQNTAKGRGESVSERDMEAFNNNIEKLKSLWVQKLSTYDKEEADLRGKLDVVGGEAGDARARQAVATLRSWRRFLFGADAPQVDFGGNIERFVAARSQWDQFICSDGSPLPVGWVLPDLKSQ